MPTQSWEPSTQGRVLPAAGKPPCQQKKPGRVARGHMHTGTGPTSVLLPTWGMYPPSGSPWSLHPLRPHPLSCPASGETWSNAQRSFASARGLGSPHTACQLPQSGDGCQWEAAREHFRASASPWAPLPARGLRMLTEKVIPKLGERPPLEPSAFRPPSTLWGFM